MNPENTNPLSNPFATGGANDSSGSTSTTSDTPMPDSLASAQDSLTAASMTTDQGASTGGAVSLDQIAADGAESIDELLGDEPLVPAAPVPGSIGSAVSVPPVRSAAAAVAPAMTSITTPTPVPTMSSAPAPTVDPTTVPTTEPTMNPDSTLTVDSAMSSTATPAMTTVSNSATVPNVTAPSAPTATTPSTASVANEFSIPAPAPTQSNPFATSSTPVTPPTPTPTTPLDPAAQSVPVVQPGSTIPPALVTPSTPVSPSTPTANPLSATASTTATQTPDPASAAPSPVNPTPATDSSVDPIAAAFLNDLNAPALAPQNPGFPPSAPQPAPAPVPMGASQPKVKSKHNLLALMLGAVAAILFVVSIIFFVLWSKEKKNIKPVYYPQAAEEDSDLTVQTIICQRNETREDPPASGRSTITLGYTGANLSTYSSNLSLDYASEEEANQAYELNTPSFDSASELMGSSLTIGHSAMGNNYTYTVSLDANTEMAIDDILNAIYGTTEGELSLAPADVQAKYEAEGFVCAED